MNYKRIIKKIFLLPVDIIENFYKFFFRIDRYILNYKPTYDEDGLFTNHNCDFMKDDLFIDSYNLGFATGSSQGWDIHWRVHILCFFAERAKTMGGDFVECGTNKGFTALSIINYVGFEKTDNKFYLMDTFDGLVEDYKSTNEKKTNLVTYKECYSEAKNTFSKFDNVVIVRGAIPDTLPRVASNKISFIHIDMNCVKPEIDAGEFFWDKIIPSGVIVLDDYAYPGYLDQKKAWDDFAIRKGVQVLSIPTGQGLIIKP